MVTLPAALLLLLVLAGVVRGEATRATRIMPLGDSITQGAAGRASYRQPLWQMLQSAGYHVDFVGSESENYGGPPQPSEFDHDHEGHWGWRTDEVLSNLVDRASIASPDIVLLHLGHNDIYHRQGLADAKDDLLALVARLREINPTVTLLWARNFPSVPVAAQIEELSEAIADLVRATDQPESRVYLVDLWGGFNAETDTYDGIHPNASGERKMAARWFEALQRVLGPPAARAPTAAGKPVPPDPPLGKREDSRE